MRDVDETGNLSAVALLLKSKYYGRPSITLLSGIYIMQRKHKLTGGPLILDKRIIWCTNILQVCVSPSIDSWAYLGVGVGGDCAPSPAPYSSAYIYVY